MDNQTPLPASAIACLCSSIVFTVIGALTAIETFLYLAPMFFITALVQLYVIGRRAQRQAARDE